MKRLLLILLCLYEIFALSSCGYIREDRQLVFEARRAEEAHEADLRTEGYDEGYSDGEDEGYRSGYEVGYAEGYAAGHEEAQTHSETFDRLIREAYASTGGAGSGFKKDPDGKIYYLETTPNGREIWVPFEP